MALKYQRILLKISGEALGGEKGMGFDEPTMDAICGGVKKAHDLGVQIGIVVGGGNFWRCLLYTSPSPRDVEESRMPSSA